MIVLKSWDLHYGEGKYENIIEDRIQAIPVENESPDGPMEDQAHEENIDEKPYHVPLQDQ
jgi:hypothetical protein